MPVFINEAVGAQLVGAGGLQAHSESEGNQGACCPVWAIFSWATLSQTNRCGVCVSNVYHCPQFRCQGILLSYWTSMGTEILGPEWGWVKR